MEYHDYKIEERTEQQKYVLVLYFTNRRPFAVKIIAIINILIFSKWLSEKVATNACCIVNIAIYALYSCGIIITTLSSTFEIHITYQITYNL